jgi:hypothetical protein
MSFHSNPAEKCVPYCPGYFGQELDGMVPTDEFIGPPTQDEKWYNDYIEMMDIPF